ncbi:MAG: S26 family signal peptidase [Muribaculaceae bacterium]|nr:S26 family signal peptidase [Muribaculaceae bacterium]
MDNNNNIPAAEKIEQEKLTFIEDFKRRLRQTKTTRWIRFAVVSLLFCGFVVWIGNPWIAIAWLLLLDIYITAYIPWGWWKKTKGPVRAVMAWVDAIIYALVLVYLIFAFIGQNYKIPSSSLEKSLLVGDYLWVSKVLYGPRVPQTPLHFPLAQHTMPVVGGKSYIEKPQLAYHRLPGLRSIERGDIVVFNYPQGDTVLTARPNEDYYMIINQMRQEGIDNPAEYIAMNPAKFGKVIYRPVDRRENYVKRCVGLPGEWLEIRNDTIYINDKAIADADNVQYNYIIPVKAIIPAEQWESIGVRHEDCGDIPLQLEYVPFRFYDVPLTAEAKKIVESWPQVDGKLIREADSGLFNIGGVYPYREAYAWTRNNISKFWIPKRGVTLELTLNNLPLYRRCVEVYEGNKVEVKNGKILINGADNPYYTFKYDYYWMEGDNRDRSLDSRYWGFVPEDHIVGSPMVVLTSFDEEKGVFDPKKYRWNRTLANPNPDKSKAAEKNWK